MSCLHSAGSGHRIGPRLGLQIGAPVDAGPCRWSGGAVDHDGDVTQLYPEIDHRRTEFLDVGDGHTIAVYEAGNPDGKPAVVLHGGPGGGASTKQYRFFDPERYRIVLIDQRGCGRSTPFASVEHNTTWDLVAIGAEQSPVVGTHQVVTFRLRDRSDEPLPGVGEQVARSVLVEEPQLVGPHEEDAAQHQLGHPLRMRLCVRQRQRRTPRTTEDQPPVDAQVRTCLLYTSPSPRDS